ncbi:MAG: aminodeoxychorismate/anthranilate synthase component II [Alphaproteobacteria bacterium]|nr:aminodeoxychorismate/anthranilate synthase component II [Alphaproteobacteria bacterium]
MLLLIDNYDSFTFNLVQYLGDLGADVVVKRNDALTAEEAIRMKPDHIVLSPGPCGPEQAGICLDLIKKAAEAGAPLLGVCLGHQCIGHAFGGNVVRAPLPMHGKMSQIHHHGLSVFQGLPSPFEATRYHSLIVARDERWPEVLHVTATTDDGLCMGLMHKTLPIHGVQFHPESIATEHGHAMLKNFLAISRS